MENLNNINCLKRTEWISPSDVKNVKKNVQGDNRANLISLITTCITENFPELEKCSETKFIKFQESLKNIINSQIG